MTKKISTLVVFATTALLTSGISFAQNLNIKQCEKQYQGQSFSAAYSTPREIGVISMVSCRYGKLQSNGKYPVEYITYGASYENNENSLWVKSNNEEGMICVASDPARCPYAIGQAILGA
jgi:hypothetical protein